MTNNHVIPAHAGIHEHAAPIKAKIFLLHGLSVDSGVRRNDKL